MAAAVSAAAGAAAAPSRRLLLVGVCGLNGSGKTTAVRFLQDKGGFQTLSLSDAIREELRAQGIEETRQNLIDMGNRLRNAHGPGELAQRAVKKLLAASQLSTERWVVDSLRHPAEVAALRTAAVGSGGRFALISVCCPAEVRYERLRQRARTGDVATLADFEKAEAAELCNPDPNGQQLLQTLELADHRIDNIKGESEFAAEMQTVFDTVTKGNSAAAAPEVTAGVE